MILDELKTKGSKRIIAVDYSILEKLDEYRIFQNQMKEHCGEEWEEQDMIFAQTDKNPGYYIFPTTVAHWWSMHRKLNSNLPDITLHGFRHSYASILLAGGFDLVTVAGMLGHSSFEMLARRYSHMLDDRRRNAGVFMSDLVKSETKNEEKMEIDQKE